MPPKYDFYEIMRVVSADNTYAAIASLEGTILGMVEDDDNWFYAVSIEKTGETWQIPESALVSTGRRNRRSDLYSGESVRVGVDDAGKGHLIE